MKNKKWILIIPIAIVLIAVNLMSRFTSIEDNLKYQYGTPIAEVEIINEDHKLILFSMDESVGLTYYTNFFSLYDVKDDFGHIKPKDDVFVAISERADTPNIIWGKVNENSSKVVLQFYKASHSYSVDFEVKEGFFCQVSDYDLRGVDWQVLVETYTSSGELLDSSEVSVYQDL